MLKALNQLSSGERLRELGAFQPGRVRGLLICAGQCSEAAWQEGGTVWFSVVPTDRTRSKPEKVSSEMRWEELLSLRCDRRMGLE